MQRISALAMVPLVCWVVYSALYLVRNPESIFYFFYHPINAVLAILIVLISLYHGALGMRVIIEDYIHCKIARPAAILFCYALSLVTAISFSLCVIALHLS